MINSDILVERVAKRLAQADFEYRGWLVEGNEQRDFEEKWEALESDGDLDGSANNYRAMARAAIEAWNTRTLSMSSDQDVLVDWLQRATADEREREAADTILSLKSEIEALREALTKCRDKFDFYEQLHRLKCTAEGDEKADRNREMADMIDAALSGSPEG